MARLCKNAMNHSHKMSPFKTKPSLKCPSKQFFSLLCNFDWFKTCFRINKQFRKESRGKVLFFPELFQKLVIDLNADLIPLRVDLIESVFFLTYVKFFMETAQHVDFQNFFHNETLKDHTYTSPISIRKEKRLEVLS